MEGTRTRFRAALSMENVQLDGEMGAAARREVHSLGTTSRLDHSRLDH